MSKDTDPLWTLSIRHLTLEEKDTIVEILQDAEDENRIFENVGGHVESNPEREIE